MTSFNQNVIRHKVGLLNLAAELGNVSRACKVMGLSRDTFYRYQEAMETGGIEALLDSTRRKPNRKNRVEESIETAVLAYATAQPAHGQARTSNELRRQGIFVSPSGVRSIWLRHDLANFKQRLLALEKEVAEKGIVLTEAQVVALEKKQEDDVAHGEIETAHPGYLGSQDTFYVGTLKGVGRIYQQTFVDTYSKVAFAKRYTTKTPITAADLLNDRVLPFFADQGMGMLRRADFPAGKFTLAFVGFQDESEGPVIELTHNWETGHYDIGTGYGHIALAVPDAYAACDAIRQRGGNVVREAGPMKGGSTVIAFVEDPDGYKIELIEKKG